MAESQRIRRKKTLIQISKKSTHAQLWRFGGSSLPVVGAPPPFGSRVSLSTGIVKHALKLYSTTSVVRFFFFFFGVQQTFSHFILDLATVGGLDSSTFTVGQQDLVEKLASER